MAITIGVYNRKGGIGKTQSVINIGACLALKGYNVLLIDGDTQNNLGTFFFGNDENIFSYDYGIIAPNKSAITLYDAMEGTANIREAILHTKQYKIKRKARNKYISYSFRMGVIICDNRLDGVEVDDAYYLYRPLSNIRDEYDFILIDFPPAFSTLPSVYLCACDYALVPAQLGEEESIKGYLDVVSKVNAVAEMDEINPDIKLLGMFYTKAMDYKANQKSQYTETINEMAAYSLFKTYIKFDYAANAIAKEKGEPLIVCAPQSAAAKNYVQLTDEILDRIGGV